MFKIILIKLKIKVGLYMCSELQKKFTGELSHFKRIHSVFGKSEVQNSLTVTHYFNEIQFIRILDVY